MTNNAQRSLLAAILMRVCHYDSSSRPTVEEFTFHQGPLSSAGKSPKLTNPGCAAGTPGRVEGWSCVWSWCPGMEPVGGALTGFPGGWCCPRLLGTAAWLQAPRRGGVMEIDGGNERERVWDVFKYTFPHFLR